MEILQTVIDWLNQTALPNYAVLAILCIVVFCNIMYIIFARSLDLFQKEYKKLTDARAEYVRTHPNASPFPDKVLIILVRLDPVSR